MNKLNQVTNDAKFVLTHLGVGYYYFVTRKMYTVLIDYTSATNTHYRTELLVPGQPMLSKYQFILRR